MTFIAFLLLPLSRNLRLFMRLPLTLYGSKLWKKSWMHCITLEHGIWLISPLENLLSVVNGFIRSRLDLIALLIATRLALLLGVLLKSMRLIMRRLLLMWLDFLLSLLLLSFMRLANGHSFRWMSKMFFLMVNS